MVERYQLWYEHEKDCNQRMLAMIDSVPTSQRSDPRFEKVLVLALHLAVCRENWLDRMQADGENPSPLVAFKGRPERTQVPIPRDRDQVDRIFEVAKRGSPVEGL